MPSVGISNERKLSMHHFNTNLELGEEKDGHTDHKPSIGRENASKKDQIKMSLVGSSSERKLSMHHFNTV